MLRRELHVCGQMSSYSKNLIFYVLKLLVTYAIHVYLSTCLSICLSVYLSIGRQVGIMYVCTVGM